MVILLIDSFHKLPNHQGDTLNPLDFLLGANKLTLQAPTKYQVCQPLVTKLSDVVSRAAATIPLLILDVFLLQLDVFELPLKLL